MGEYYIAHHGIPGQKWGVRHGPPYPLRKYAKGVESHAPKKVKTSRGGIATFAIGTGSMALTVALAASGMIVPYLGLASITAMVSGASLMAKEIPARIKSKKIVDQIIEEREDAPIDEETGLKKKTKEYSIEEDVSRVNPEYNAKTGTTQNCALCSITYDMRRRGYDVSANYASYGYTNKAMASVYKDASFSEIYKDPEKFDSAISSNGGTRGIITMTWSNGSGHAIAYEKSDSGIKYIDAQCNKIMNATDFSKKYLSKAYMYDYMRTDDKELNVGELENTTHDYTK